MMKLKLPPREFLLSYWSITSTMLHLKLIREVPVIQTLEERLKLEDECKGKQDILFMFTNVMFSSTQLAFLQISQEFKSLKFAIASNEKATENLAKSKLVEITQVGVDEEVGRERYIQTWLIRSSKAKDGEDCQSFHYDGMLVTNRRFLENWEKFGLFTEAKWTDNFMELLPYNDTNQEEDNRVYLVFNGGTKEEVEGTADFVGKETIGVLQVITINMDETPEEAFKLLGVSKGSLTPPSIIFTRAKEDPAVANNYENAFEFIIDRLDEVSKARGLEMGLQDFYYSKGICDYVKHLDKPQKQDDMVLQQVEASEEPNLTHITALNENRIEEFLKTREITLVLYHVKWDHLSKATIHILSTISNYFYDNDLFDKPIAMLDCFDWNDLCAKHDVWTYPTIKMFSKGLQPKRFQGIIDVNEIISSVYLHSKNVPLALNTRKEVEGFLNDQTNTTSAHFLAVFQEKNSKGFQDFLVASQELRGQILTAFCTNDLAMRLSIEYEQEVPFIIVSRQSDLYKPITLLEIGKSTEDIKQVLLRNKILTLGELRADNFQQYNLEDIPIVILLQEAGLDNMDDQLTVGKIAMSMDQFNFAWMNRSSSVAQKTVEAHGLENIKGNFILALHRKENSLYVFDEEIEEQPLRHWLIDLPHSSKLTQKLLKKGWTPLEKPYDYRKLAEQEEYYKNAREEFFQRDEKLSEELYNSLKLVEQEEHYKTEEAQISKQEKMMEKSQIPEDDMKEAANMNENIYLGTCQKEDGCTLSPQSNMPFDGVSIAATAEGSTESLPQSLKQNKKMEKSQQPANVMEKTSSTNRNMHGRSESTIDSSVPTGTLPISVTGGVDKNKSPPKHTEF